MEKFVIITGHYPSISKQINTFFFFVVWNVAIETFICYLFNSCFQKKKGLMFLIACYCLNAFDTTLYRQLPSPTVFKGWYIVFITGWCISRILCVVASVSMCTSLTSSKLTL